MIFTTLKGKKVNVNVGEYLIDWNKAVSKPQKHVKDFLFPYWKSHVCVEELACFGSLLRLDIVNLTRKIAVEVSPSSTHSFNKFFHKNRFNFAKAMGREFEKEEWCMKNGFQLVEIFDEDMTTLSPEWFSKKYNIFL